MERYAKNFGPLFSPQDQEMFLKKTFAVLGCGGQGGYVAEFLCRLGVKKIILFDGDFFEVSNLNRQVGANHNTLHQNKAKVIADMCSTINSNIQIDYYDHYFGDNQEDFLIVNQCDFIFDEMDYHTSNKQQVRDLLRQLLINNIPITNGGNDILGSVVSIITNRDIRLFDAVTAAMNIETEKKQISQPAYLCAITAGLEVNAMIKFFTHGKYCPIGETYHYDFYHNHFWFEDQFGGIK